MGAVLEGMGLINLGASPTGSTLTASDGYRVGTPGERAAHGNLIEGAVRFGDKKGALA